MCFDVCTWRVKACVPGPLRESEFKEPHIWGFTAGFEGTVFCQAAEYPSSSMQAPRQQGIHAADRNTNECAALCFSGVPIDSHFLSCGQHKPALGWKPSSPGTAPVRLCSWSPLRIQLASPFLGFFQAILPPSLDPACASPLLHYQKAVLSSAHGLTSICLPVPSGKWDQSPLPP